MTMGQIRDTVNGTAPHGSLRLYLDQVGLEAFRNMVEERFGALTPDPGSVFDTTPRSHYGIHPQKQDGLSFAGLHVPVGRLTAQDLQDLATASLQHGGGEVRLTEDQNVIIVGLAADKLEAFKADPLLQRFPLEPGSVAAGTSCTEISCVSPRPTPRIRPSVGRTGP